MELKKQLGPFQVWGLAVGLVISGEYFGWSYGWGVAGTGGFLVSTLLVALLYTTFVFSFTELTCAIPDAGGPFTYGERAFGRWGGFLAGIAALVEFVFAPPAIAFALGSYMHVLHPSLAVKPAATVMLLLFAALNLLGVKQSARFELIVTLLAVAELLVFVGVTGPKFESARFWAHAWDKGPWSIFAAVPYAIWFFLAIEGVAMAAEEVKRPGRDLPIGYVGGILTLVVLAVAVMLSAGGVGDWRRLTSTDFPIPGAVAAALGEGHPGVKWFAGIGLFGLLASLNGIVFSASRQVFAVARAGLLPSPLARLNRFAAPDAAIGLCVAVGLASIWSGRTDELITLSAIGALVMYIVSLAALFRLRKIAPSLARPYRAPLYPVTPALALVLCGGALVSTVAAHHWLGLLFIAVVAIAVGLFALRRRK
jgi:ethanolamine permease